MLWEQIEDFKIIWVKETDEYFEIKVSITDSLELTKTITGTPVPEAELSQILLSIEINTEDDIALNQDATTFYNQNKPRLSLLHRVLSKATGYAVVHVDDSLKTLQRTFSVSDSTIYDFLVGECSEQFHCIFQFDSKNRTIRVYDLETYGEDTTIYVDKSNLTDSISLEVNTDNVKNCFKLVAGDESITAAVRMLNPNGSDYIYHIPEYLKKDMPAGLREKLKAYNELYESKVKECEPLAAEIYKLHDDIAYLESGMMPKRESFVSAEKEAQKLNKNTLNLLGLETITLSTSIRTVNSAITNLAKVFVMSGYVKIDVDTESEPGMGLKLDKFVNDKGQEELITDVDGYHSGTWVGKLIITNYSDKNEVASSDKLTISITDNCLYFAEQKVLKAMTKNDPDGSIFDVLSIKKLDEFKHALTLYSKNRLVSFYDAIKFAQETLQQLNQASKPDDENESEAKSLYNALYEPYTNKLNAIGTICSDCKKEIDRDIDTSPIISQCPYCDSENIVHGELDKRIEEIRKLQEELSLKIAEREEIINTLNLETNLGEYYPLFSSYRRESVYSNDNYFSDGLSNTEIIAKAKEFIKVATEELYKSSEQQVSISASLYNLLLLPEFAPLVDKFETGNWIRVRVDGMLYKLRLLSYEIDFDNTQTLNVEFTNVPRNNDLTDEIKDILGSAKSMGQSYDYVAKQAEMGGLAQENINDWVQHGLNTGLIQIQSGANKEITTDEHGILCRAYDDISGTYDAKQLKITNNCIVFTDNNWQSVRQAIGEHHYGTYDDVDNKWVENAGYGLTSDFVQSGQVSGATIIGGKIFSMNYSNGETYNAAGEKMPLGGSYINLDTGEFSFGGDSLYYRKSENEQYEFVIANTAIGESLKAIGVMDEKLHIKAENIVGTLDNDISINNTFVVNKEGQVKAITLTGNAKIPWERINNTPTIPSDTDIKNTIKSTPLSWGQIMDKPVILSITDVSDTIQKTVTADYVNSLDELALDKVNSIKTNDLYLGKSHVLNPETNKYETGITGAYTIGDKTIRIVNGIIVEIQEQSNK